MKWTIAKKMLLMGAGVLIAMGVLAGISFYTNITVEKETEFAAMRNNQLGLVTTMREAAMDLLLAAMDSIIDKNDGRIEEERNKIINDRIAFIENSMDDLKRAADTDQEKKAAQTIEQAFPDFARMLQVTLVGFIEQSYQELKNIQERFVNIEDALDQYGDEFTDDLETIRLSVQKKQAESAEMAALRNDQMGLLNQLTVAHSEMMLAAMNTIIDKDLKIVDQDHLNKMKSSIDLMNQNLDALSQLADTNQEQEKAKIIVETLPLLSYAILDDLTTLVETGAAQFVFDRIHGQLSRYVRGLALPQLRLSP